MEQSFKNELREYLQAHCIAPEAITPSELQRKHFPKKKRQLLKVYLNEFRRHNRLIARTESRAIAENAGVTPIAEILTAALAGAITSAVAIGLALYLLT
jgi:hypothetical protein